MPSRTLSCISGEAVQIIPLRTVGFLALGLVLYALATLHAAAECVTVIIHVPSLLAVLLGLFATAMMIAAADPVTVI